MKKLDADHVFPGLFVGSQPPLGNTLHRESMNRVVLCAVEYQPPDSDFPGVIVTRCPFRDEYYKRPTPQDLSRIVSAAWQVAMAGLMENVLVTCRMGRNRSALVAALAMQARGVAPDVSIETIRKARPIGCLENPVFLEIAMSGLMKKRRRSERAR